MFRDRPFSIVANATEISNQVSEIRSALVNECIKDRASALISSKQSELEQYLEKPQFPLGEK